jgi:group II intron reverse transcriptase/maturase
MELEDGHVKGTKRSESTSTKVRQIAKLARKFPDSALTTLAHRIDLEWLREAYRRTRKDGAVGVDGQSAQEYAKNLDENLQALLKKAKTGQYRAPPVRRVHIPKDGGKTRPLGIPTFEDKVLQRAVVMVLEPVYEQEFCDCSYGFRPGRSPHQALEALDGHIFRMGGGWVLDLDISSYFDTIEHGHLRELVQRRVRDGVLTRLIDKWLKAGVMEKGRLNRATGRGTPQGGVISPMLANIYLHHVLDAWWEKEVLPRLQGQAHMVRFADDVVMVFRYRDEAEQVLRALVKRFARYGLKLNKEKTKLVRHTRPPWDKGKPGPRPGTFDFLGFTHYWGRSRKGRPVPKKKTAAKRLRRTLKRLNEWLKRKRHQPVRWQHRKLCMALRGHDAYYGVTGNGRSLNILRYHVERLWRKWLDRRSWRTRMNWQKFKRLLFHYPLPPPRVVHSVYR